MKFADFIKISELKELIVHQIITLGLSEEVATINDRDLDAMITIMAKLSYELESKCSDQDKIDYLVAYIIGLLSKLIISYGADVENDGL